MKRTNLMAVTICTLCAAGQASAAGAWRYTGDTQAVSVAPPAASADLPGNNIADLPGNNMLMTTVTRTFGEPDNQAPAVGKPPITRWYYPLYTVYFELDRVITSVQN